MLIENIFFSGPRRTLFDSSIYRMLVAVFFLDDYEHPGSYSKLCSDSRNIIIMLYEFISKSAYLLVIRNKLLFSMQVIKIRLDSNQKKSIFLFLNCRQSCWCSNLTENSSDRTNGGDFCSLTESRYSRASSKYRFNRSQTTPRMGSTRQSNYRSPGTSQSRGRKRPVQQQSSQSSLVYGYPNRS